MVLFFTEKYDKESIFKFLHRRPPAVFGKIKIQAPIAGKIKKYPPIPSDERIRHRKQEKKRNFFPVFLFFSQKAIVISENISYNIVKVVLSGVKW
ncbi:MAG TPA: hypothetical protein DD628_01200 [Clostridiales bacterium]|nr:hypothetical protein [Candidatus Apopatosoma intestinale]